MLCLVFPFCVIPFPPMLMLVVYMQIPQTPNKVSRNPFLDMIESFLKNNLENSSLK